MTAFDKTFRSAIPGSSIAYKWGSYPHTSPPKYTDPNAALELIWKQLHQKNVLKQLWYLFEKGATVSAIAKALLYKMAMDGTIQSNLAINLYPTVGKMLLTLAKAKGIDPTVYPKTKSNLKDTLDSDTINELMGKKSGGPVPKSALSSMHLPKPEVVTQNDKELKKLQSLPQPNSAGLLNMSQGAE